MFIREYFISIVLHVSLNCISDVFRVFTELLMYTNVFILDIYRQLLSFLRIPVLGLPLVYIFVFSFFFFIKIVKYKKQVKVTINKIVHLLQHKGFYCVTVLRFTVFIQSLKVCKKTIATEDLGIRKIQSHTVGHSRCLQLVLSCWSRLAMGYYQLRFSSNNIFFFSFRFFEYFCWRPASVSRYAFTKLDPERRGFIVQCNCSSPCGLWSWLLGK